MTRTTFDTTLAHFLPILFANGVADPWLQNFDCQIFSSEVRLAKPDPAIFQFCLQNLEMNGRDVLIVDDRYVNIEAVRQEGLAAICFPSTDVLRADLNKIDFDVLP